MSSALDALDPVGTENRRRARSMSTADYWNLPTSSAYAAPDAGLWDPQLQKSQGLLAARSSDRRLRSNAAEDEQASALPDATSRIQASMNNGFNRRGLNSGGSWDTWLEGFTEAGEGGRDVHAEGSRAKRGSSVAGSIGRASMQALNAQGATPQRYGFSGLTNDETNSREYAPTFEQDRQGAMLAGMDARVDGELQTDRFRNEANFDLGSGQAGARAQMQGSIARDQTRQNARAGAQTYFDPNVRAQREDTERAQLEGFNARYSNPAVVRSQAMVDAAQIRSQGGLDRESIKAIYDLIQQQQGDTTKRDIAGDAARARLGSAAVTANPRTDVDKFMPGGPAAPADPAKTMTMGELQDFARSQGMQLSQALEMVRGLQYNVVQ